MRPVPPGPGPLALSQWAAARKAGLKAVAKLQVNTSWEICAVPNDMREKILVCRLILALAPSGR